MWCGLVCWFVRFGWYGWCVLTWLAWACVELRCVALCVVRLVWLIGCWFGFVLLVLLCLEDLFGSSVVGVFVRFVLCCLTWLFGVVGLVGLVECVGLR